MSNQDQNATQPSPSARMLYTMIRVVDLQCSLDFYLNVLGMRELKRETFTEGRYFTLVFIGYGDEASNAVIELTYNWDEDGYELGTGYDHVALEVADIYTACERLEKMSVKIIRKPGLMTYPVDKTGQREDIAFIENLDGYKIELIQSESRRLSENRGRSEGKPF